jgi:hypothetical protein
MECTGKNNNKKGVCQEKNARKKLKKKQKTLKK